MSETDDPNNHAPEVSPDDDWDDSNDASFMEGPSLPPRRGEVAPAPKAAGKLSAVKLYPISPVTDETGRSLGSRDQEPEPREEQPAEWASSKRNARKSKKSVPLAEKMPEAAEQLVSEEVMRITAATPVGYPGNEGLGEVDRMVGPGSAAGKRVRVHEIGSDEPVGHPVARELVKLELGPERQIPQQEGGEEAESLRARRRLADGELVDWGEGKGREPVKWMLWAGLGIVALVVLIVILSLRFGGRPTRESEVSIYSQMAPFEEVSQTAAAVDKESAEIAGMLWEGLHQAREIFARYVRAEAPEEIADVLFNSEEVLPLVKANQAPLNVPPDWQPDDSSIWSVLEDEGTRYAVLEGTLPNFDSFTAYFRNKQGELKLDWKATTGYGTATFEELARGEGDGSEIRCVVTQTNFFTFSLPEGEFSSFRLTYPEAGSNLWAYVRTGSKLEETLTKLFTPSQITGESQREVRLTLRLSPGPKEGLANQWMIEDLIRLSWLDR